MVVQNSRHIFHIQTSGGDVRAQQDGILQCAEALHAFQAILLLHLRVKTQHVHHHCRCFSIAFSISIVVVAHLHLVQHLVGAWRFQQKGEHRLEAHDRCHCVHEDDHSPTDRFHVIGAGSGNGGGQTSELGLRRDPPAEAPQEPHRQHRFSVLVIAGLQLLKLELLWQPVVDLRQLRVLLLAFSLLRPRKVHCEDSPRLAELDPLHQGSNLPAIAVPIGSATLTL
mmetsp:Transcript_68001/g.109573  ORF Transcript_68001/g.109573 Transcript_68001/m.109573 type:complete len:225 (+) Transcript_68001:536-1210(+)